VTESDDPKVSGVEVDPVTPEARKQIRFIKDHIADLQHWVDSIGKCAEFDVAKVNLHQASMWISKGVARLDSEGQGVYGKGKPGGKTG
jgi:hypothetical protein